MKKKCNWWPVILATALVIYGLGLPAAKAAAQGVPNPPSNLRVTGATQNTLTIAWDPVPGVDAYRVYRWNGSSFAHLAQVGADFTTSTDIGRPCGWADSYRVAAVSYLNGMSAMSDFVTGRTLPCTGPAAPENLTGSVSPSGLVSLSWADRSTDEDRFEVERSLTGTFYLIGSVGADVTDFVDNLGCGHTASYRVAAGKGSLRSLGATVVWVTTAACPPAVPAVPGGVMVTLVATDSLQVSWWPVPTAVTYTVQRWGGVAGWLPFAQVVSPTTWVVDTDRPCGWADTYRVRAENGAGTSAYSPMVTGRTPACQLPTPTPAPPTPTPNGVVPRQHLPIVTH